MTEGADALLRRIELLLGDMPPEASEGVRGAAPALAEFLGTLRSANESMNLVSASAVRPEELVGRHLRDALEGLPWLPAPAGRRLALLDLGSGGGFPAVPILLVRRDIDAWLVESTGKKARFLSEICARFALTASVHDARFPDSFPMTTSARFDLLTSRAVADAGRLVRRAQPLLRQGARALLWTTERLYPEIRRASGCGNAAFHRSSRGESRGIAVLQGFT